jgi:AmmeMemoRadiSam system protein A
MTMNSKKIPEINPAAFAREVIAAALEYKAMPDPPDEEFYRRRAACFICLKKSGDLRGCIGTIEAAEESLGREIIRNAQSAAFADPRFPALVPGELPDVNISVDVLSEPEVIEGLNDHDCKIHGVIVSCDYRRGVLLPDLEGVESVEQQLDIACQKAGIATDEEYKIHRFTVDRYSEDDPQG